MSVICPHCETTVQFQATSVARSGVCPSCGEGVMLQVAERSTGVKRKALLMQEVSPSNEADDYTQRQFQGTAFDRMRADPELMRAKKRLVYGVSMVATLIVVAIAVSLISSWTQSAEVVETKAPDLPAKPAVPVTIAKQSLPPMLSRPMDFEQIVKKRRSEMNGGSHESGGQ